MKRFPPPWTVEHIPGGFKVRDATRRVSLLVAFGFLSCLEITLAVCGAFAAQEAKKPTLYVDKIETNEDEVFVIYSYQTGFPPDTAEILQVALAQCRRLGFHNAVRSEDPTIRQCLAMQIGVINPSDEQSPAGKGRAPNDSRPMRRLAGGCRG